jgi:hypothetical protein
MLLWYKAMPVHSISSEHIFRASPPQAFFTCYLTNAIRLRAAHYLNAEKMFKNLGAGVGAASGCKAVGRAGGKIGEIKIG